MNNNVCGQLSAEALVHWAMTLDESAREFYEERAGILQFQAELSRIEAERQAYQMTLDWMARRIVPIRRFIGVLAERNGEFEYTHRVLFDLGDLSPQDQLTRIAQSFYSSEPEEADGGYYFFCGGIYIAPKSVVELTEVEYAVLSKFL
jgi:hypothetical protein